MLYYKYSSILCNFSPLGGKLEIITLSISRIVRMRSEGKVGELNVESWAVGNGLSEITTQIDRETKSIIKLNYTTKICFYPKRFRNFSFVKKVTFLTFCLFLHFFSF